MAKQTKIKTTKVKATKVKATKVRKTPRGKYTYALGRRKTASATVRLYSGREQTTVNGKEIGKYFPDVIAKKLHQLPLEITKTLGSFYASFKVVGGGKKGQLEAAVLALSRALIKLDPKHRLPLREAGLLTVDARARERRKAGQMGRARKKKQSPKR
ncbi:MAG: 30S ribosomal protein S9 [Patescibacteria group bacterium]